MGDFLPPGDQFREGHEMMVVVSGMVLVKGLTGEVHWPVPGQLIPLPNEAIEIEELVAMCGARMTGAGRAGVGWMELVQRFELQRGWPLIWCPQCFPLGRPA